MTSHVFLVGSPGSGKTYYLLNNFVKMVYVTFIPYTALGDHVEAILKSSKSVGVVLIDSLRVKEYPRVDVLILDCSMTDRHSEEFQIFLIETMNKNKSYFTTFAIDECQTILPNSMKQSKTNTFLDHLSKSRNYGYRIILASQRPQAVSSQAIGLMTSFMCMKLTDRNGIKIMNEALDLLGISDYVQMNQNMEKREIKVYEL